MVKSGNANKINWQVIKIESLFHNESLTEQVVTTVHNHGKTRSEHILHIFYAIISALTLLLVVGAILKIVQILLVR